MNRRRFLYEFGVSGVGLLAAPFSKIFAQDSQTQDTAKLAKEVAQYACENRRVQGPNYPMIYQHHVGSVEYIDSKTGEDVSEKLPWKTGSNKNVPFQYATLDPKDIPSHVTPHYFTETSIDIVLDNVILFAHAKVYHNEDNKRDYNDPRNSLEVSFFESGRTLEEMRPLSFDVITSLRKTFGVSFLDSGIDGLADVIKGAGNQQMYLKGLQYLVNAYTTSNVNKN